MTENQCINELKMGNSGMNDLEIKFSSRPFGKIGVAERLNVLFAV